ncbi:MAG TPA: hypothetical protein VGC78_07240 [Gaiellaceae bacterium]
MRRNGVFVVPAAAIAVHQLRYWLAYGPRANAELAAQGHSYLHSLLPWAIFALAAGGGLFLRRIALAAGTGRPAPGRRRPAAFLWIGTWGTLVALYVVQETLEALLATGHPGGAGGVVGHGGWWAVPAAAAVAAAVTALLVAGGALVRVATESRRVDYPAFEAVAVPAGLAPVVVHPLARRNAGRAPPATRAVR